MDVMLYDGYGIGSSKDEMAKNRRMECKKEKRIEKLGKKGVHEVETKGNSLYIIRMQCKLFLLHFFSQHLIK